MDGRCYGIRIVRIDTRAPEGSSSADFLAVARVNAETGNPDGKGAVPSPFKSGEWLRSSGIPKLGTFERGLQAGHPDSGCVQRRS